MSTASLKGGAGPGSSISLAPETIQVRNALIEKFSGEPLEDMQSFMVMALSNETDELRRLGILAARIYLLRSRVAKLREFNRDPSLSSVPRLDMTTLTLALPNDEPSLVDDEQMSTDTESWSKIQMTEPGEVNGVRFLSGTIIDVQVADADKLINSGKAVRIDEEENVINQNEDDLVETHTQATDTTTIAADDIDDSLEENEDSSSSSTDDETVKDAADVVGKTDSPTPIDDKDPEIPNS